MGSRIVPVGGRKVVDATNELNDINDRLCRYGLCELYCNSLTSGAHNRHQTSIARNTGDKTFLSFIFQFKWIKKWILFCWISLSMIKTPLSSREIVSQDFLRSQTHKITISYSFFVNLNDTGQFHGQNHWNKNSNQTKLKIRTDFKEALPDGAHRLLNEF